MDKAFALLPDIIIMDLSLPGDGRLGGDAAAEGGRPHPRRSRWWR